LALGEIVTENKASGREETLAAATKKMGAICAR
jgi:hypothetical protein